MKTKLLDGSWTNLFIVFALMWVAYSLKPTESIALIIIVALQLILLGSNLARVLANAASSQWQAGAEALGHLIERGGKQGKTQDIGFIGRQK